MGEAAQADVWFRGPPLPLGRVSPEPWVALWDRDDVQLQSEGELEPWRQLCERALLLQRDHSKLTGQEAPF